MPHLHHQGHGIGGQDMDVGLSCTLNFVPHWWGMVRELKVPMLWLKDGYLPCRVVEMMGES